MFLRIIVFKRKRENSREHFPLVYLSLKSLIAYEKATIICNLKIFLSNVSSMLFLKIKFITHDNCPAFLSFNCVCVCQCAYTIVNLYFQIFILNLHLFYSTHTQFLFVYHFKKKVLEFTSGLIFYSFFTASSSEMFARVKMQMAFLDLSLSVQQQFFTFFFSLQFRNEKSMFALIVNICLEYQ